MMVLVYFSHIEHARAVFLNPMFQDTIPMEQDALTGRTMASSLASDIRTDIIEGALPPGSKLRIKDLCERYTAGSIPMREALSRLAASGFVVVEDQRGFRVSDVSMEDLIDITETRIHIECQALQRSIERGNLEWEERLLATHHRVSRLQMSTPTQRLNPEWEHAHVAFHAALLSASESKWLCHLAALLRDQTARYRLLSVSKPIAAAAAIGSALPTEQRVLVDPAVTRDIAAEHKAITDAALARNTEAACGLLRAHLQATTNIVLRQSGYNAS